jgi:hypothetical protein
MRSSLTMPRLTSCQDGKRPERAQVQVVRGTARRNTPLELDSTVKLGVYLHRSISSLPRIPQVGGLGNTTPIIGLFHSLISLHFISNPNCLDFSPYIHDCPFSTLVCLYLLWVCLEITIIHVNRLSFILCIWCAKYVAVLCTRVAKVGIIS